MIFATHLPLVFQVNISLWQFIPEQTDGWKLVLYLASVVITVTLGMGASLVLAWTCPKSFAFLNGGRLEQDGSTSKRPQYAPAAGMSTIARDRGKPTAFRSP